MSLVTRLHYRYLDSPNETPHRSPWTHGSPGGLQAIQQRVELGEPHRPLRCLLGTSPATPLLLMGKMLVYQTLRCTQYVCNLASPCMDIFGRAMEHCQCRYSAMSSCFNDIWSLQMATLRCINSSKNPLQKPLLSHWPIQSMLYALNIQIITIYR